MSKRYTIVQHDTGDIIVYLDGKVNDYIEDGVCYHSAIKLRREFDGKVFTQYLHFKDGKLHRDDGPAVYMERGGYEDPGVYGIVCDSAWQIDFEKKYYEYWLNGVKFTKDEYQELLAMSRNIEG